MIIVMKKKHLIIAAIVIICIIVCGVVGGVFANKNTTMAINKKTIIIDAGHGGSDKGVVGKNGTIESEKNLEIANMLKTALEDAGFFVVMTRTGKEGATSVGNFKREDFERRKKIVEKYLPDILVSIHCNKFPQTDRRGVQIFYNKVSDSGKMLAEIVQKQANILNKEEVGKEFSPLKGEYFMLNCTMAPSIIAECGFLSNIEDEKLLNDKSHLEKIVGAIRDGIISYFDNADNKKLSQNQTSDTEKNSIKEDKNAKNNEKSKNKLQK